MGKKIGIFLLLVLAGGFIYFYLTLYPQFPIANGYAAKKMCSCTFIAERSQESIQKTDLGFDPISLTKTTIDHQAKSVTTTLFGLVPRTAVFKKDLGCVLLDGKDDYDVSIKVDRPIPSDTAFWPLGKNTAFATYPENIDRNQLKAAIENAFDPNRGMDSMKTRAVLVVYNGQLIEEEYAPDFDAETEILGWSMTKSITGTMIGILVKNGVLSLEDKSLFPDWTDDRKEISLQDLMQMQSGLEFVENYGEVCDATQMLFMAADISAIPQGKSLIHKPGKHWYYSSGTTNLLSRLVRDKINADEAYWRFPYDSIFNRINMYSAIMETDEAGNFMGSSYCYATPRDWAKFGMLYLNQGNWYGDQVIDSTWVDFVRQPAAHSEGIYGGQFWLNADRNNFPDVPGDAYFCNGFQGQHVVIIPSYDLVVVRMGLAEGPMFDLNKFLKELLASFEG